MGATTRVIIDSVRTVVVWFISLAVGWASFSVFHLLGFISLILGIFIYNNIIDLPRLWNWTVAKWHQWSNRSGGHKRLINQEKL